MTNFKKTIIFILAGSAAIALIFLGMIVLQQQKAINSLQSMPEGSFAETSGKPAKNTDAEKKFGPPLVSMLKAFSGEVADISGNQLVVRTKLADFSQPKDPEKIKDAEKTPTALSSDDFEVLEKSIEVDIEEETVWEGVKGISELKAGDWVQVFSDKSPYEEASVAANKIIYVNKK